MGPGSIILINLATRGAVSLIPHRHSAGWLRGSSFESCGLDKPLTTLGTASNIFQALVVNRLLHKIGCLVAFRSHPNPRRRSSTGRDFC
jgi:hypothetical protein